MKTTRTVRIVRKTYQTKDIVSYRLRCSSDSYLPVFSAGSHIDVHLPGGLTRQYSLCNSPAEPDFYEIAVLLDPNSRGGSSIMHRLHEGATLDIGLPRNSFPLADQADRHLLIAGGIGVTPLLAMSEVLASRGESFELHYCTRSAERTAFSTRISDGPLGEHTTFHHDDGEPSQRFSVPQAETLNHHLYVCGPSGFIQWVLNEARGKGWCEQQLHWEHFTSDASASSMDNNSFEVVIASTGLTVVVRSDQTVAAALAKAGIDVPVSCEQGVCGTCVVNVVEGSIDHRDVYLTSAEQASGKVFTPCCSRSHSARLVLDL